MIVNKRIPKERIKALFDDWKEGDTHPLLSIIRMVQPNYDMVKMMHDWPKCNENTWKELCGWFIDFDKKHSPGCFAGGLWMNKGFSQSGYLDDWQFRPAERVQYYGDPNPLESVWILYGSRGRIRVSYHRRWDNRSTYTTNMARLARRLRACGMRLTKNENNAWYFER